MRAVKEKQKFTCKLVSVPGVEDKIVELAKWYSSENIDRIRSSSKVSYVIYFPNEALRVEFMASARLAGFLYEGKGWSPKKSTYMWFFKRKIGTPVTAVIHDDCHAKLPPSLQARFYPAPEDAKVTHNVVEPEDDDNGFGLFPVAPSVGIFEAVELGSEMLPTENYSIDTTIADTPSTDTGADFGGGDGGGAGASGDF